MIACGTCAGYLMLAQSTPILLHKAAIVPESLGLISVCTNFVKAMSIVKLICISNELHFYLMFRVTWVLNPALENLVPSGGPKNKLVGLWFIESDWIFLEHTLFTVLSCCSRIATQ